MKHLLTFIFCCIISAAAYSQNTKKDIAVVDSTKKIQTVEASCGQCNFKLKGGGCSLAVRIDGKAYFVDGAKIDQFGDAHEKDGFCEAIRKAEVQGEVVKDRFEVSYFKLLPEKKQ